MTGPSPTSPKITIIIPTRERLAVLRHCLETVLAQQYENLQIIVSDNCSTDGTGSFVEGLGDPRVRYINTGRRVSMAANYEFALSHVDGGWVMFLGDDDGVLPGAVGRLAAAIAGTDCEAITFTACSYFWPDGPAANHLTVPLGHSREVRSCRVWLNRVMNMRSCFNELPIIYDRGVVKVDAIDRIRKKGGGVFFKSSIPDVYSAIALASEIDRYLFMADALTIAGASSFSTGAAYGRAGMTGVDQTAHRVFAAERSLPFHPNVPLMADGAYPPSCQALVYETYLQSSFLRKADDAVDAGRQLELALADPVSPAAEPLNETWGRLFAKQNGLDFERHFKVSARLKRFHRLKSMARQIRMSLSSVVVHDTSWRLRNVFEASVAAAAVQWLTPSLPFRMRQAWAYKFGVRTKTWPLRRSQFHPRPRSG
jgi:glycosyltransferase involved in cell wall biosynthesis